MYVSTVHNAKAATTEKTLGFAVNCDREERTTFPNSHCSSKPELRGSILKRPEQLAKRGELDTTSLLASIFVVNTLYSMLGSTSKTVLHQHQGKGKKKKKETTHAAKTMQQSYYL